MDIINEFRKIFYNKYIMTKSFKSFTKKLNKTRKLYTDLRKEFDAIDKHTKEVVSALEYYGENPKKNKDKIVLEQKEYLKNLHEIKKDFKKFRHMDCDLFAHRLDELDEDFVDEFNKAIRNRKPITEKSKK